jgi:hypothetical protein
LRIAHPHSIRGAVAVKVRLGLADRRPDVDNYLKALLDLLVAHEVIEDDAQVVEISARLDRWSISCSSCPACAIANGGDKDCRRRPRATTRH